MQRHMLRASNADHQVWPATPQHRSKVGGLKTRALPLGEAMEKKMRIVQVPSKELNKLSLSMDKLIRQGLGGNSTLRLGSQSEHRSKPLPDVGLPSDANDSVWQVG